MSGGTDEEAAAGAVDNGAVDDGAGAKSAVDNGAVDDGAVDDGAGAKSAVDNMAAEKGAVAASAVKDSAVKNRVDWRTLTAVAITISCWAANFPTIRFAVQEYDPRYIALLRFLFASVALGGYALAVRMPLPKLGDLRAFAFFGLTGLALSTLFLGYGLSSVSAGAGSFLVGTIPIFSALLARFFLAERLGPPGWLGIAVSFSGMGLIALGESQGLFLNPWAGLVVLSAFLQAIFYVFQKPYHLRYTAMQITAYTIWFATLWLLVFLPGLPSAIREAGTAHTAAVAFLGVFPTGLAFAAWAYALGRAKAAKVTSAMYVMPALVLVLAFAWLGEVPSPFSLAGGVVAIAGVLILNVWGR